MPKKKIDYSKSCVYRLIYNDITYYVGSTTNMRQRKSAHSYNTNKEKSEKYGMALYQFIRENGGWKKWVMVLIQEYPLCKTSDELRKYERLHYDFYKPSLNSQLPHITDDEKKIYQREYGETYRENNKEQIIVRKQVYYTNNKDRILEKCKIEYAENSDRQKQYYQDNIDTINEKRKKRCECECGVTYASRHKIVHKQTQKHINRMNEILLQSKA